MKKHRITHFGKYAPRAYVSNGFIGMNYAKNSFCEVVGLLGSFTAVSEIHEVEALAVVPALEIDFSVDGIIYEPEIIAQNYDFSCGEFSTEAILHTNSGDVSVLYTVFASRTSPTLLFSSVKAEGDCGELRVACSYKVHENWGNTVGEICYSKSEKNRYEGKCHLTSRDNSTSCGVAFKFFGNAADIEAGDEMRASAVIDTKSEEELYIVTSYVPSVMHGEPHNQAQRMLQLAGWNGM